MGSQISARVSIESRYQHILPSLVSEIQIYFSLGLVIETQIFQSWYRNWDSNICSLGLVIETDIFSVSVLVSSLRLTSFQSRSWCHHWDFTFQSRSQSRWWDLDIFSLGLGLNIETQTFSVSVSVSLLRPRHFQSRSRFWWSKYGVDQLNSLQHNNLTPQISIQNFWGQTHRWTLQLFKVDASASQILTFWFSLLTSWK